MGQFGFFDADKRLAVISAKGDPLEMIDRVVPFESFRAEIEAATLTPASEKKSNAGRKPIDVIVMFRMLVLQSLYNLSDEQVEYQVRDRLSFTRFLRLGIEDGIPDRTTLWLFRETLAKAEAKPKVRGFRRRIHQRASRNHPLSKAQENANRKKSRIRARVEHVFGAQQTSPGGRIVRTIGIARAKAKIGLQNLAYNIRRLVTLERMATA